MSTFVLIHGAMDGAWTWHRVAAELRGRGHVVVAPDLPSDDESATFPDYADAVLSAVPAGTDPADTVVVGHSLGAFTAPLVADRLGAPRLVLVAPMIPSPGERPDDWWDAVGHDDALAAASSGGTPADPGDPLTTFLHDVDPALAAEAQRRARPQSVTPMGQPWPGPDLTGRAEVVLARHDRFFPADLIRRLAEERAGTTPTEVAAGHQVALVRPRELADLLEGTPMTSTISLPTAESLPFAEDAGTTPWDEAVEHLRSVGICWLSTVRADGSPHTVPLLGLWFEGTGWFAAGRTSQKARNLAHEARCTLAAPGDALDLSVEGTAELVTDPDVLARVADEYRSAQGWDTTVENGGLSGDGIGEGPYLVHRLVPRRAVGIGKGESLRATRWTWA